jgi:anti-anti-sigma factor
MLSIGQDGGVRVAMCGQATAMDFAALPENPLKTLLGDGWARHRLLMDLSAVEHVDSAAIGWLLTCHRELAAAGGSLVLHSLRPKVRALLNMLKLERVLPLVKDEPAAHATLAGDAQ